MVRQTRTTVCPLLVPVGSCAACLPVAAGAKGRRVRKRENSTFFAARGSAGAWGKDQ